MKGYIFVEKDGLVWRLTANKWLALCKEASMGQFIKMRDFGIIAPKYDQKGIRHGFVDYYIDDWDRGDFQSQLVDTNCS